MVVQLNGPCDIGNDIVCARACASFDNLIPSVVVIVVIVIEMNIPFRMLVVFFSVFINIHSYYCFIQVEINAILSNGVCTFSTLFLSLFFFLDSVALTALNALKTKNVIVDVVFHCDASTRQANHFYEKKTQNIKCL